MLTADALMRAVKTSILFVPKASPPQKEPDRAGGSQETGVTWC